MISDTLTMEERVSLIVEIFSDRDQVEMVRNLSGDDAQTFIDVTDEASFYIFIPQKSWNLLKPPYPVG